MMELEKERQREALEKQQRAAAALNKSVNIAVFRSFNLKGKDHQMKAFWSKRLFEIMFESNGTDELKAAAILEFFEIMMSTWWLYCRHLALILEVFHIGCVAKSSMGSYRVELVVMWFDHILDVHNFEVIMMVLTAEEQAALYARIGTVIRCAVVMSMLHFMCCFLLGCFRSNPLVCVSSYCCCRHSQLVQSVQAGGRIPAGSNALGRTSGAQS